MLHYCSLSIDAFPTLWYSQIDIPRAFSNRYVVTPNRIYGVIAAQ